MKKRPMYAQSYSLLFAVKYKDLSGYRRGQFETRVQEASKLMGETWQQKKIGTTDIRCTKKSDISEKMDQQAIEIDVGEACTLEVERLSECSPPHPDHKFRDVNIL